MADAGPGNHAAAAPSAPPAARYVAARSNRLFLAIVAIPITFLFFLLSASIFLHPDPRLRPLWLGVALAVLGMAFMLYAASRLTQTVVLRAWVIEWHGLLAHRQIRIQDVTSLNWRAAPGC